MVRLVENVRLVLERGTAGRRWLVLEMEDEDISLRRTDDLEFRRILRTAGELPYRIAMLNNMALWMYREEYFCSENDLTTGEVLREIQLSLPSA